MEMKSTTPQSAKPTAPLTQGSLCDNQTIKALECCGRLKGKDCDTCPLTELQLSECTAKVAAQALDIINRQKAEIERMSKEVKLLTEQSISSKYPHCVLCGNGAILTKSLEDYDKLITDISAEAYNEFAERLTEKATQIKENAFKGCYVISNANIDNLVKELKEGNGNA